MHWLQGVVAVAGALAAWRWAIRPVRRGWRQLIELLTAIRVSSAGVQKLAREVESLAGAVVQLVVSLVEDNRSLRAEHEELRGRQSDQADLLLEVMGDMRDFRNQRTEKGD